METVLSGIRPTGNLHLGNYFGALRNFIRAQEEYKCFFFIADYHSLTTHPKPSDLNSNVRQILIEYLAMGLDPEKSTIYIQSDVPEVLEIYLFLNMNAYMGELERCTSFKDKVRQQPDNVNAGLLTYPTLMAADILMHRSNKVPVGKDQEQHLEMTRTFANRFNHIYGADFFPEPSAFNFGDNLIKIPGLNGTGKMGKSEGEGNAIFFNDAPEVIRKKIMRATTDSGPVPGQPKSEAVENIFTLLKVVSPPEIVSQFESLYEDGSIRYGDLKKQLADDMVAFTSPFREKIMAISADKSYLARVAAMGRDKARESAIQTLKGMREIIGFKPI